MKKRQRAKNRFYGARFESHRIYVDDSWLLYYND